MNTKKNIALAIINFLLISCGVKRNVDSFEFKEVEYVISGKPSESNWINFEIYLISNKNNTKTIYFSELSTFCHMYYDKIKKESRKEIKSLKDVDKKYPTFVLESPEGKFKYFLDRRNLPTPIYYEGIKIIKPITAEINICNDLYGGITKKRNTKGKIYIRNLNIYDYDLKFNDNDTIVKIHYIYKNEIISSNWINLKH